MIMKDCGDSSFSPFPSFPIPQCPFGLSKQYSSFRLSFSTPSSMAIPHSHCHPYNEDKHKWRGGERAPGTTSSATRANNNSKSIRGSQRAARLIAGWPIIKYVVVLLKQLLLLLPIAPSIKFRQFFVYFSSPLPEMLDRLLLGLQQPFVLVFLLSTALLVLLVSFCYCRQKSGDQSSYELGPTAPRKIEREFFV